MKAPAVDVEQMRGEDAFAAFLVGVGEGVGAGVAVEKVQDSASPGWVQVPTRAGSVIRSASV